MKKRIISLFLAMICIVTILVLPVSAEDSHEHVWTEKSSEKTLKECKVCGKGFEYYEDPESGEVVAWTEYVLTEEGKRSQPISHYADSDKVIEWEKDGEVQFYEQTDGTPDMYYVNGKIYYYIPYAYKTSKSTVKKLAQAAKKKVSFSQYAWGEGNWNYVSLMGKDNWFDIKGGAWAAVDAGGTKYVIVQKYATEKSPDKYYAIKAKW